MGMLPNPIKQLGDEMNRRTWVLVLVCATLVAGLFLVDRRLSKTIDNLKQRIEALERRDK